MKRTRADFPEDLSDSDEEWETDPALTPLLQHGGALFNFHLQPEGPRRNWRNVLNRQRFQSRVQHNRDATARDNLGAEITDALRRSIQQQITRDATLQPWNTVHFTMQSNAFSHAFQSTTFTVEEFTGGSIRLDTYLNSLADKLNSNEDFDVDDTFTMETTFIRTPAPGSGHGNKNKPGKKAIQTLLSRKKSVIEIKNTDQLCCARAIVTMKALADAGGNTRDPSYKTLRQGRPIQGNLARNLHSTAGVPEGPCGLQELQKFQSTLPDYQIKVLSVDKPHCIIFAGPPSEKMILLIKADDHYHGCNSFGGFLSKSYFCHDCNRGYDHDDKDRHRCDGKWCNSCERKDCKDFHALKATLQPGKFPKPTVRCTLCNRSFFGEECYHSHLHGTKSSRSLCDTTKKCLSCCKVYEYQESDKSSRKKYKHKCGWSRCPFCTKEVQLDTHRCFIQPVDPEEDDPKVKKIPAGEADGREILATDEEENMVWVEKPPPLFVYADYEAMTDPTGLQEPILICAETEDSEDTEVFYGASCTEDFINYLDEQTVDEHGEERKVICLFHNFKGYDGMFVLKHLYDTHREVTTQICIGTKILSLSTGDLTFKDSLCFLPFPLSQFPDTFGIEELSKGFFPHQFNTASNQDYEGRIPDIEYYDPEGMSAKMKKEFEKWHAKQVEEGVVFNLKKEMEKYCVSDVKLLKAGCQKFQDEFKNVGEFKPIEKCITIASACNRFWRKMLLPRNKIAVEPPSGWHGATTNQSIKAVLWLTWKESHLQATNPLPDIQADRIKHSFNGGEIKVFTPAQSFRVDGYDELTKTVYEFHGCFWHGCPKCFPNRDATCNRSDRTFQELYEATKLKERILFSNNYSLHTIWECEWDNLVKTDPSLQEFLKTVDITPPLNPREGFFGGRTNAVTLYHKADESLGEQIRYVDVTSLYPWVNKYAEYPTGHPEIITHPTNQDINIYFGMAKVSIIPPFQLYHPVLPYRCKGKLVFPLCKTCVESEMAKPFTERSEECTHTEEERTLTGTWCTPEIQKAVEVGYRIVYIHEVWHFPQKEVGLFASYVNTWLKLKQQASGYPKSATTPEAKEKYVKDYKEREGIDLDPAHIEKNSGQKATAKLMLNSFWGKFGENLDKPATMSVTSPAELFRIVGDPLLHVHQIRICNDELLEVVYSEVTCNKLDNGKRNIFVAAFTTCHARLKLYTYLEKLKTQVLYFDTDSVVYKWKPGQTEIPLGNFLGEMTDELEDPKRPGDFIREFVSGGPKNYGYITDQGAVCCKVRGFSLKSVRGSSQLNYEILRQNLLEELTNPQIERRDITVANPHFFTRDPSSKRIKIIPRNKLYGLVFDKRVVNFDSFNSFPYGFKKSTDTEMAELLCDL